VVVPQRRGYLDREAAAALLAEDASAPRQGSSASRHPAPPPSHALLPKLVKLLRRCGVPDTASTVTITRGAETKVTWS
jgi:hypothetical protein